MEALSTMRKPAKNTELRSETSLERLERQIIERQLRKKEQEDINQGYHVRKTDQREMFDQSLIMFSPAS